jgi:hypothetical protein
MSFFWDVVDSIRSRTPITSKNMNDGGATELSSIIGEDLVCLPRGLDRSAALLCNLMSAFSDSLPLTARHSNSVNF